MKTQLLLLTCAVAFSLNAKAQVTTSDTSKTPSETTTARVFDGASQYSTWSIGVNVGVTSGQVAFLSNSTNNFKAGLGYGVDVKDQLSHAFAVQFNWYGGTVTGDDVADATTGAQDAKYGGSYFKTPFNSFNLSGVFNIGSISFLHRQSGIILYGSAGLGMDFYTPSYAVTPGATAAELTYPNTVKEIDAVTGLGLKFKLSNALDLNLGYTVTYVDNYNFAGFKTYPDLTAHYGYTYTGLAYTFGTKTKPSLEWANPVATMYDELYDPSLRAEVEALKGRVANAETAVNDLKKDSDGDGVSDQFDKCPNTPPGTVVDGSGCPLPPPIDTSLFVRKTVVRTAATEAYGDIQFEYNSPVMKPASYAVLDITAADLKASGARCELDGFTSMEEGSGTEAHNLRLSGVRANAVKTYLVNAGVAANNLRIRAFGDSHPIADNSTEEGRVQNRRVEFKMKSVNPIKSILVKFNPGKSDKILNPQVVNEAVSYLTSATASTVTLIGHCSSSEPFSDRQSLKNDKYKNLALARLKTVAHYLIKKGIKLSRITKIEGSNNPFNGDDHSISGKLDNHTVEIILE
jgi:OOP family OmpA-OmpF porin